MKGHKFTVTVLIATAILIATAFVQSAFAADVTDEEHYGNFITSQPELEFVFDTLLTLDMLQTANIKHTQYVETNPLLGERPSDAKIAAYGASVALLHAAITYEMVSQNVPKPIITAWEFIGTGIEAGYVGHNYKFGVKVRF